MPVRFFPGTDCSFTATIANSKLGPSLPWHAANAALELPLKSGLLVAGTVVTAILTADLSVTMPVTAVKWPGPGVPHLGPPVGAGADSPAPSAGWPQVDGTPGQPMAALGGMSGMGVPTKVHVITTGHEDSKAGAAASFQGIPGAPVLGSGGSQPRFFTMLPPTGTSGSANGAAQAAPPAQGAASQGAFPAPPQAKSALQLPEIELKPGTVVKVAILTVSDTVAKGKGLDTRYVAVVVVVLLVYSSSSTSSSAWTHGARGVQGQRGPHPLLTSTVPVPV